MGRFFWILMGVLGGVLLLLIVNHDKGTVFGIENGRFGAFAVMSAWGILIASAFVGRGRPIGETLKQIVIWLAIIVGLMAVYIFRFDLQDIGSRLSGGLIPGSPISTISENGIEVTLIRSSNGHFEARGTVNDAPTRFLVDTGATSIVLTDSDARRAGISPEGLSFTIVTSTANGQGRAAEARIREITVGDIKRQNLRVLVAEPDALGQSLLGQVFLESLASYERRGDRLMLRD